MNYRFFLFRNCIIIINTAIKKIGESTSEQTLFFGIKFIFSSFNLKVFTITIDLFYSIIKLYYNHLYNIFITSVIKVVGYTLCK